jgi:RES domain-containing protein
LRAPLTGYTLVKIAFDDERGEEITPRRLPRDWRKIPPPASAQLLGNGWVKESRSAILALPSAVVPHQLNDLLNPQHPGFRHIRIGKPISFPIDERLPQVR